MNWFTTSIEKAMNTSNMRMEAFINASIGDLAMELNLYKISDEFYSRAHSLAHITHEGYLQCYLELCIAKYNRKIEDYKQASIHINIASEKIDHNASKGDLGLWYLEDGQLDISMGKINTAIEKLKKAIDIFKELNQPIDLAKSYLALGIVNIKSSNGKYGYEYILEATTILSAIGTLQPILPDIYFHRNLIVAGLKDIKNNRPNTILFKRLTDYENKLLSVQQSIFPSKDSRGRNL